jgi:hypothetical protein
VLVALIIAHTAPARADDAAPARGESSTRRLDIEVGPTLFLLHGWQAEVGFRPLPHLRVLATTFALTFPSLFLAAGNDGWTARHVAGGVGADYLKHDGSSGWFAGAQLVVQYARYSRPEGETSHVEVVVSPHVGYLWFPWTRSGWFATAALDVPLPLRRPDATVGDATFQYQTVMLAPSVTGGLRF